MPFMDSHAVIESLRKIRPDIKIIVASASEEDALKLSLNYKTQGFVPKPFTTEELVSIVHRALAAK